MAANEREWAFETAGDPGDGTKVDHGFEKEGMDAGQFNSGGRRR